MVDFGGVSVGSMSVQSIMISNPLDTMVHVVIDVKGVPELRQSTRTSQVIPAGARGRFDLELHASEVGQDIPIL